MSFKILNCLDNSIVDGFEPAHDSFMVCRVVYDMPREDEIAIPNFIFQKSHISKMTLIFCSNKNF